MARRLPLVVLAALLACAATPSSPATEPTPTVAEPAPPPVKAEPVALTDWKSGDLLVMPNGITSFGAVRLGDHVYVAGGYYGQPHAYNREEQVGDLLRLDVTRGTWEKLEGIEPAQSVVLVDDGRKLWRVGGMQARNAKGEPEALYSLSDFASYDPAEGRWVQGPALPQARSSHDAVRIGDEIIVVGGWVLDGGNTRQWPETVLRYDLKTGKWSETPAGFRRRGLGIAAAGGKVVAIGGITPSGEVTKQVDVFDPNGGAWTKAPDFPGTPFGVAAVGVGETVIASGADGVWWKWKHGDAQWSHAGTMALGRAFHRLVPDGAEGVLALGGIGSAGRVRVIEAGPSGTAPRVVRAQLANPVDGKNRQGVFLRDNTLYAFGGNRTLEQHSFRVQDFTAAGAKLDLDTLTWSAMASYPAARQTIATWITADGRGMAVGGFGHDGDEAHSFPEVSLYDFKNDTWRPNAGSLPGVNGRTQMGLVEYKGALWGFGGLDYDPSRPEKERFRHATAVLRADLSKDPIVFAPTGVEVPTPRRAFAGAELAGKYYLLGGLQDGFGVVTTCEVYDFAKKKFGTVACPNRVRVSGDLVALGGKLYLGGGSSRATEDGKLAPDASIEVFDPATGQWSVLVEQLPIDPAHTRLLVWNNRLLVYGAHHEEPVVDVLLVDPS